MIVTSIPVLRLLVVFAVFWNGAIASPTQPPNAEITPMPKVEVRQLTDLAYSDPRFVGWEVHGGSIYQRTCTYGYTYTVSNSHYACCTTDGPCYFATGCAGLYTALFTNAVRSSVSCESSAVCVTGSLYWSTQDTNPYTFIGCGSANYWVVQSPDSSGLLSWTPGAVVANPTTPKGSTVTTSPPTTSSPAGPSIVTTTPVPTAPLPAAATSPSSGGGGGSSNTGAIIGGAVGGGAVAIGLIVLGVLLFFRRKRNNAPPAQPVTQPPQPYPNQPGQPPQDMRPMSYIPPNSPPPPWDGAYSQQHHSMMAAKPPMQYQYETVPKEDPHFQPQQYSPQMPQAVEMHGTPATRPMEMQGAQRQ